MTSLAPLTAAVVQGRFSSGGVGGEKGFKKKGPYAKQIPN